MNDVAHGLLDLRVAAAARMGMTARRTLDDAATIASADHQTLLLVIGERAARSYDASVMLASRGDGIQAAMLNRSLLEDALDVVWIEANSQVAAARADEHDRAIYLADRDIEWKARSKGSELTHAEQEELRAAIRRYRGFQASWTLGSEPERVALLKARMPADAAPFVDYTYDAIKRRSNALLHGSPASWRQLVDRGTSGLKVRYGLRDHWWLEALRHAILSHHLVARSIAIAFGLDPTAQNDAFHYASCVTLELRPEQLAVAGTTSPCPCGSGGSFEGCHGLPSGLPS
jgi:hypothetical protein